MDLIVFLKPFDFQLQEFLCGGVLCPVLVMVGTKYLRAAILISFGLLVIFITTNRNVNISKKPSIQIENVIEVVFENFSKIKENMRYLSSIDDSLNPKIFQN